jgi:bifunctional DNA-binding transcriptional regulator/antitoxin component of YhaV-PrlF toxin-antitoxin module
MEPLIAIETFITQMKADGTLELPADFRAKHNLAAGDPLTIIRINGHLIIAPRPLIVPEMADKIAELREQAGFTINDLLAGLETVGEQLYAEQYGNPVV